jgi:hypothetical protein
MGDFASSGIASIIIIGVVIVGCVVAGIVSQKYLGPDNEIEKISEEVIKDETGLSVNLDVPEKKK